MRPEDWPSVLDQLNRHSRWRGSSPDQVGLVELMRLYDVPAVSVAVWQEGARPWARAYGAAGPRSIFQACSISKHVAAFGALRLVDQGVLELDEDIDAYLSSWRVPETEGWRAVVTLRQLLAHTAGLSYNWFRGFDRGAAVPTITEVLRGEPPATSPPVRATMAPGSAFRYSGSHYAVLQQLMEDVTGAGFAEVMRSLVLEPLGMADSSYDQDFPSRHGEVAVGHHLDGTPLSGGWRVQPELAGAGLWTTPSDLCRVGVEVARAVDGRSGLLSGGMAKGMVTAQVAGGFGLGTAVEVDGGPRFGHTGGNAGYGCWLFTWPSAGASVAVMVNNEMAQEVLWSVLAAAERLYGRGGAGSAGVAGAYRVRDDFVVRVVEDGGLVLQLPGQRPLGLRSVGEGRFRTVALDCEVTFENRDGEVALLLRQQDVTLTGICSPE